jgi:CBS domain-containing protein
VAAEQTPQYVYSTDIRPFIDYDVPLIDEDAPLNQALAALGQSASHTVLLKKPNSRQLAGIITNSDLSKLDKVTATDLTSKKAKDLATTAGVVGVKHDAMLWQLLRLINGDNSYKRPFDHVPVVDSDKQVVGLIDRESLNRKMLVIQSSAGS